MQKLFDIASGPAANRERSLQPPVDEHAELVRQLIANDLESMLVLRTVEKLNLPDWAIGAGFVRSLVWDHLHGYTRKTALSDIDVLYFDPADIEEASEKAHDRRLQALLPGRPWSTKNQARMHLKSGSASFVDTLDGMRNWLETPTAVAVCLKDGALSFLAPFGFADLCNMIIRPTPAAARRMSDYRRRVLGKPWREQWPKVRVLELEDEAVPERGSLGMNSMPPC